MKIEKITPQIAALYLGQKCEYPDDNGGRIVCFLTGVSSDGIETTYKKKRSGICGDILGWKANSPTQKRFAGNVVLHLRRLNSITEDESLELYAGKDEEAVRSLHRWIKKRNDSEMSFNPAAWLYLLSKGFDLFGLIDSGLAKEVTCLKAGTIS